MQDAGDIVENIYEDGSPIIGNPNTDSLDDKEDDNRSMSVEDEDEDQDNVPEDEKNKDVPKTKPTSDTAKRTMETSTGNTTALSSEELKALKKRKPMEYLKAIISARGSSTEKFLVLQQCQGANLLANLVMNFFSRLKKRPSTLICSNFWKATPLPSLGSKIS